MLLRSREARLAKGLANHPVGIEVDLPVVRIVTERPHREAKLYVSPLERLAIAIIESALRDLRQPKHRQFAGEWIQSNSCAPFSLR